MDTYEKKYNEALAWMRELYPELHGATKEDAEHFFPELRESEDERIAEELIKALRGISTGLQYAIFLTEEKKQRWLAWLEKQKENPKNADSIPADCASNARCPYKIHGDEDFIGDIKDTPAYHFGFDEGVRSEREKQKEPEKEELVYRLNGLMQEYINEAKDQEEEEHRFKCYKLFWDALEDASYFEQKEHKPVECVTDAERKKGLDELTKFKCFASALSDMYNIIPSHSSLRPKDIDWNNFCAGLLTYLKRNQPVEWSEEDERRIDAICELLENTSAIHPNYSHRKLIIWLKDLRPIKQEWSKKDEDKLYQVMETLLADKTVALRDTPNCKALHEAYDEMLAWLKSLRPSWKPSEEQMKALQCAIVFIEIRKASDYDISPLKSLYEHLKKL